MAKQYFLGIDTSTTSSKALLIDEEGKVVGVASSPHTLQTPKPLWSEQDPREWWEAVSASIKQVLKETGAGADELGAVNSPQASEVIARVSKTKSLFIPTSIQLSFHIHIVIRHNAPAYLGTHQHLQQTGVQHPIG